MESLRLKDILLDQSEALFAADAEAIARDISLRQHLEMPEISVLTGVRRCGKSTLLRQLAREHRTEFNIHYINFEDFRLAKFTLEDFEVAYREFLVGADDNKKNLLLYDEVETVIGWERWVSSFSSNTRVKIFVTGSNATLLNSELATLLTGRHEQIAVTPLRFREIVAEQDRTVKLDEATTTVYDTSMRRLYNQYKEYGAFPRAFLSQSNQILAQYYEDIILKDMVARRRIRNVTGLRDLGSVLASQNTRLFNRSKIALDLEIKDTNTLSKFCNYFVEAFLFHELRCFSPSRRKQLKSQSKFYAVDPILAKKSGYHHSDADYWILENFVFLELASRFKEVWYWISKGKFEVDLIVRDEDGTLQAFQVSLSIRNLETRTREIRAIEAAFAELQIEKAWVITESERESITVAGRQVEVVPFYRWATA